MCRVRGAPTTLGMAGKRARTKLTSVKIATRQSRKGGAGKHKTAKQLREEAWFDQREAELAAAGTNNTTNTSARGTSESMHPPHLLSESILAITDQD